MNFGELFSGVRGARAEIKKRRDELELAKRRREDLRTLPVPIKELAEIVSSSWATERASEYPAALAAELSFFIRHPLALLESKDGSYRQSSITSGTVRKPSILLASALPGATVSPENALLYLLAPVFKETLRKGIEAMPYPAIVG